MTDEAIATKSAEYHLGMLDCWLITSRAPEQIKRALKAVHLKIIAGTDTRADVHPLDNRVIIEKAMEFQKAIDDHIERAGDNEERGSKSVSSSAAGCKPAPFGSEGATPSSPTIPTAAQVQEAMKEEAAEAMEKIVGKERVTYTRDQKVDLIRMKKFAGWKWHEIAEAMQLPQKKLEGYWFYLQQSKDFEALCTEAKMYHDNPKLWAVGSNAGRKLIADQINHGALTALKAKKKEREEAPEAQKPSQNAMAPKIEQESLENYRRAPVDQVKRLEASATVAAIKATAPRADTPVDTLITKHNEYAGKRDPGQQLQDSDWPDIQEMLRKGRNIRQVAHDYDVEFSVMNAFCDKNLLREARESDSRSRSHNTKGK